MNWKISAGFVLLTSIVMFTACEKKAVEKDSVTIFDEPDYFPLKTGSYWVYNSYKVDGDGNEKLISMNDTLRIIGDTTIRGNMYKIFYGKRYVVMDKYEKRYYRDSSGYIVNDKGRIVFSTKVSDTLLKNSLVENTLFEYTTVENIQGEIAVPAGVYDSLLNCCLTIIEYTPDPNIIGTLDHIYAPNIGTIIRQNILVYEYSNTGIYYEERLIDYYIAL